MRWTVNTARDSGVLFSRNAHRMAGLDGAYSIPLDDERTLWFFGDTLIGERAPDRSLWYEFGPGRGEINMSGWGNFDLILNNTGIIVPGGSGFSGKETFAFVTDEADRIRQLIHNLPDEPTADYRIWCLDGVTIGTTVYLYYLKILMIPGRPVPANFAVVGGGVAKGDRDRLLFTRVGATGDRLFWSDRQPGFGSAVLHRPQERRVYLYGYLNERAHGEHCYLARVFEDEIEVRRAYEYWSKDGWTHDLSTASSVFGGMPNEMSVSWNPYLESFLAVHSLGMSGKIVARTASAPWGPWSEPHTLWSVEPAVPATDTFTPLIYAGKEHPEMSADGGRTIYVTYIEFEEYFPHLIEIRLERCT